MSAAAFDRQIKPIYDALDTGSNKSAIVAANKLLKKHPKNELIKALKALALVRSQKVEESLVLCDEVLEQKPTDDAVLTAMMHVLRGLGRHNDLVAMFEEAYKKQPTNEELGAQTFFANVRASNWKSAHQVATRMFKQFQEDRYLYWSVISAVLQAKDTTTPPAMRPILFKLAHRLITSSPTPSYVNAERFHLHLSILYELELWEEADKLLSSNVGKNICSTSLSCNELRRSIWKKQGRFQEEAERAEKQVIENKDRNWLEFLAILDGAVPPTTSSSEGEDSDISSRIEHTRNLLEKVVSEDGLKDRSGRLALLELEKRTKGSSNEQMATLLIQYFDAFGDKSCCFEDLKPYYYQQEGLETFTTHIATVSTSFTSISELYRLINSFKLRRYATPSSEVTVETEIMHLTEYTKHYFDALTLGASLPSTELQPADDLMLLAANAFISLWKLSNDETHLLNAVYLLEFGLTKSKQAFLARLVLIRLYRLLGAPYAALEHYRIMQIKQVQHDTLSHLILSRASTFSLASTGDITLSTECLESTQIYLSNSQETGDFVTRAFTSEKYSQIPEFILFEDWLENSLQRDMIKIEHLRMRLTHEPLTSDMIDMELIELKFIFDRCHYDNRDFAILPNYQPRTSENIHQQTSLFGKCEGNGWLSVYLKAYIRAFQQASDLDDTVEEKLLIGDRPKQTGDFDKQLSLRDRLVQQRSEDKAELTEDEINFIDFVTALTDWLEPYHNFARPPPSVVLAEAAKQTELKTGHPLKGVEISQANGTNGHHKKDEEPPVVEGPPEVVSKYFENAKFRLLDVKSQSSPTSLLHVATLIQEAFLLFVTETLRFKSASVVKVNKFGALVSSFKDVRASAVSVLKEISTALIERGEAFGTADERAVCVEAVSDLLKPQIEHDFLLNIAKKLGDARRKVSDGVGKGISRILVAYP